MTTGWSLWVMALVVFNLGVIFFLFLWAPHAKIPVGPDGTTGHVWADGKIREGLHKLPRWWLAVSWAMFLGAFGYLVLYPGFGAFQGVLGWTSVGEHDHAAELNAGKLEPELQRLQAMSIEQAAGDPVAQRLGARLFIDNCAACHGRQAQGNHLLGAPRLDDEDWLYGGSAEDILASITDGRTGAMPPWNSLGAETVRNLAQYVRSLSMGGLPHDAGMARMAVAGEEAFKSTCVACHGSDGKGNPLIGAPNLTDSVWLYGGSLAEIEASINNGRQGEMPAWQGRLSAAEIHLLAAYVLQLSQADRKGRSK